MQNTKDNNKENGIFHCPLSMDIQKWKEAYGKTAEKVDDMHQVINKNFGYLAHLPAIAQDSRAQTTTLERMENNLIGPATQRDQIGMKSHLITVGVLGLVILGLSYTVIYLVTGEKFDPIGVIKSRIAAEPK